MANDRKAFIARCIASGMTAEDAADFADEMERDEAELIERETQEIYERLMTIARNYGDGRSRMDAYQTKH